MVYYEDLLAVPYLEKGRDYKIGLDCYGLVIELARRNGQELLDITQQAHVNKSELADCKSKINLVEIKQEQIKSGDILQCIYNDNLHMGYIVDKHTVIHMTNKGLRLTPIEAFKEKKFGRII